jgi:cyclophilin family peptidyl-prolyl cis-trans isomerase
MLVSALNKFVIFFAATLFFSSNALATNVVLETVLGDIEIELFDDETPQTVANFLNYVRDDDFDDTFFHRSIDNFVIQGGGFKFIDGEAVAVPTDPPVPNEPGISNVRGTIAMAKLSGDPDSATSGWFINLVDNSANLDAQNGGFTVFGQVVGNGMEVVDAIAALRQWNAGGSFTDLPLIEYSSGTTITAEHLVMMDVSAVSDFVINAGVNDAWVQDDAPFQGMFLTAFEELGLIFVAWFTFDSAPPVLADAQKMNADSISEKLMNVSAATFGADDQRWVTALGTIDGNRATLKAELTTGGSFNSSTPTPTQDTDYGSITLEFENCSSVKVDFDFPKAEETGSFNAHRVLEDNVALCESLQPAPSP